MFEKEIKFISDFCRNKISKAGSFLTFEKLKGIEIHPAILKYISAEMDFQIFKDRQVLLQKSAFDYSGSEISKYLRQILSSYMGKKQLLTLEKKELEFLLNKIDIELFSMKVNELINNAL